MVAGISTADSNYVIGQAYLRSTEKQEIRSNISAESLKVATVESSTTAISLGPHLSNGDCDNRNFQPKSAIAVWNLNKFLRRFGVRVPSKYCTKMWCVKDIGGYIAAGFTWALIAGGETLVLMNCLSTTNITILSYIAVIVSIAVAFLGFFSHCQAMFSDPGTVQLGTATEENISQWDFSDGKPLLKCIKCNSIKPERAHHCSTCQRCIRKMDHHCPWINNCVGEENQKFFVLFTGYICLLSCIGFAVALSTLVSCVSSAFEDIFFHLKESKLNTSTESITLTNITEAHSGCYFSPPVTLIISIGLIMEGLLFGLFTAIMCGTQMSSICSDQTGIESLKKERRKRKTCHKSLKEVFGGNFSYRWFLPFHYLNVDDSIGNKSAGCDCV